MEVSKTKLPGPSPRPCTQKICVGVHVDRDYRGLGVHPHMTVFVIKSLRNLVHGVILDGTRRVRSCVYLCEYVILTLYKDFLIVDSVIGNSGLYVGL